MESCLRTDEELELPFPLPAFRAGVEDGSRGPFPHDHGKEKGEGPGDHQDGEETTVSDRFHEYLPMCRGKPAFFQL